MQKKALSLNLSGWVKNRDDGRVEAVFQGNEKTVRKMLDWLWQGSPGSKVKGVKQLNDKPIKDFEGFEIRY
jgi:acylphosphatase